jgi:phosphate:Na+ symporter
LVVNFHSVFNLALAGIFILPTRPFARLLVRVLPEPPRPVDPGLPVYLEEAALDAATIALSNASRETLRMADMLESMLKRTPEVLGQADRHRAAETSRTGQAIDQLGGAIRAYLADLGNQQPLDDEQEGARAQEILAAVINLEHAGNIVANGLMDFAFKKIRNGQQISSAETAFIAKLNGELLESLRFAVSVFLHGDQRDAKHLLERKSSLRQMEMEATSLHVRLLREAASSRAGEGDRIGVVAEQSGLFLTIVGDLRRVHSHIATLAYPTLNRGNAKAAAEVAVLDPQGTAENGHG